MITTFVPDEKLQLVLHEKENSISMTYCMKEQLYKQLQNIKFPHNILIMKFGLHYNTAGFLISMPKGIL